VAGLVTVLELGWTAKVLTILLVATAIHLVDAFAIQPAVLGRVSNLHPLTVLLALLAGGDLFGLWGLFLAVPFIGMAKIVIRSMDQVLRRRDPQPV
jgi:predicted PurR-regulated permease PerM